MLQEDSKAEDINDAAESTVLASACLLHEWPVDAATSWASCHSPSAVTAVPVRRQMTRQRLPLPREGRAAGW